MDSVYCGYRLQPFYMSPEDMSAPVLGIELEAVCKAIKHYETHYVDPHKRGDYEALYPWRDALNEEMRERERDKSKRVSA